MVSIDYIYVFEDGQRWVNFWKNAIIPVEKVMGDRISTAFKFNEKFDCGFIVAGDLNHHLYEECRHRNVYIGAKVPPTASEVERQLAREAEEAMQLESESQFSIKPLNSSTLSGGLSGQSDKADGEDALPIQSIDSAEVSSMATKKKKKFKKRINSVFANKNTNDISYCVEINPKKMSKLCDSLDLGAVASENDFIGQQTAAHNSIGMAYTRQDINDFLQAPARRCGLRPLLCRDRP
jgi:hypothetical protein